MKKTDTNVKSKKENRLEKVVVFLLVVLISLLSFSVGVISGKGLSDKEYALKSADQKYSHAFNTEAESEQAGENGDLSDEEIQQLANAAIEAAEKENSGATAAPAAEVAAKDPGADTFENKSGAAIAKAVGTKAPASIEGEDERLPSSVKKAADSLEYTVQVASYPTSKDAESLAASYIKKGFPAFPFRVTINGQEWYRVSIGSFKTKKEAMSYQNDLKKQGVVKDSVVQKITK